MSASTSYADVIRMLEACASGFKIRLATHSKVVSYKDKVFRDLPKFDNLELGHVRKMVRHLGIEKDCAKKHCNI